MVLKHQLVLTVVSVLISGGVCFAQESQKESHGHQSQSERSQDSSSVMDRAPASAQSQQRAKQEADARAVQATNDLKAGREYQVIEFDKNKAELSENSKNQLRTLIENARASGPIESLHVAVWSDKEFPTGEKELPKSDQNLAQSRIKNIESYIEKTLNVDNVETYSMAEKSNWFARAISTTEAELRSLFSQKGAPANLQPEELNIVKKEGGPSKAVVLVERSQQQEASGAQSN